MDVDFFSFLFLLTFHVFSACSSSKKASVLEAVCVCVCDGQDRRVELGRMKPPKE